MKILIVDDHPIYAEGLKNLLSTFNHSDVLIAHSGEEALSLAVEWKPEVVLMDIGMPGMDGIRTTAEIKARLEDVKVVMLTSLAEDELLFRAIKAGASGYLIKTVDGDTLARCLADLQEGRNPFSAGLEESLLAEFKRRYDADGHARESSGVKLSERQEEILALLAEKLSYKEIGSKLFISERTVKFHIERIKAALDLTTKEQLVDFALERKRAGKL